MGMGTYFANGHYLSIQHWNVLRGVCLMAAGYKPHCPCGCVSAKLKLPEPTPYERKHGWKTAPAEPLLLFDYPEIGEIEPPFVGFIEAKYCEPLAARIESLLGEVKKIEPDLHDTFAEIAKALRENGQKNITLAFS